MTTVPVLQQVKEAVARGVAELRMSPEALVELFEQLAAEPDNAAAEDGAKHPRRGEPGFVGTYNNVPVFVFGRPEQASFVSANEQLAAALDQALDRARSSSRILESDIAELVAALEGMVRQHCRVDAQGLVDSGLLGANLVALQLLTLFGRFQPETRHGDRLIGRWRERSDG